MVCHAKIGPTQKWSPGPTLAAKNGPPEPLLVAQNGPILPKLVLAGPNLANKIGLGDQFGVLWNGWSTLVCSAVTESHESSLGDKICCLSYDYICVQNWQCDKSVMDPLHGGVMIMIWTTKYHLLLHLALMVVLWFEQQSTIRCCTWHYVYPLKCYHYLLHTNLKPVWEWDSYG